MSTITLTSEQIRVIRAALLYFIVEENKTAFHLKEHQCFNMADSINVDIKTGTDLLKMLSNH